MKPINEILHKAIAVVNVRGGRKILLDHYFTIKSTLAKAAVQCFADPSVLNQTWLFASTFMPHRQSYSLSSYSLPSYLLSSYLLFYELLAR